MRAEEMPTFSCDFAATPTRLNHAWEHTVGSCHAPLALRADWQAQMLACHRDLGFGHVRFHGLLSDDMGTLICHQERPLYSFFNADQVMDFLLSIGMRPFVELSFMPEMLASGHNTVFHYRGNVTPPASMDDWGTLIAALVGHWVDRYGAAEVGQWFFEVWNEPNLAGFWTGTRDDYFALYRATALAIKRVDPTLRVGGPVTAAGAWIDAFLEFCRTQDVAVDFVSTHFYPTDALGAIGQDTETQLATGPRDAMLSQARTTRAAAGDRPLYYTEWSSS